MSNTLIEEVNFDDAIEAGSLTEQVDNAIAIVFIQIWFGFWFCRCSEAAEGLVLVLLVLNFVF